MSDSKAQAFNIELNLKRKEEEKDIKNNLEEEESLRYDKKYIPLPSDCSNIKLKEQNAKANFLRKSSTLSTTVSLSENGFKPLTPIKRNITKNEINNDSFYSECFFGRNRFYSTPISDYFDGIDNYFKKLNPEKNNYQKSNNYLKKETFLMQCFGSFDLKEEDLFTNKFPPKLSYDFKCNNLIPNNSKDKIQPPNSQSNIIKNSGKIDYPIYYFGYYNIDCK